MVVPPKRLVEITATGIAQHGGDLLDGQWRSFEEHSGSLHPQPKQDLGKATPCFPSQKPGNVVRMIGKMLSYVRQRDRVGVFAHKLNDLLRQRQITL